MILTILFLLGNIAFNAAANILMKIGTKRTGSINLTNTDSLLNGIVYNPSLLIGVLFYGFSLIFYLLVLKKLDLSIAYPISVSSAIIVVTIASGSLLGENISWNQIIGVIIIMFGIFLLTR